MKENALGDRPGMPRKGAGEEILGRYVVERVLGVGTMGVLYACVDKCVDQEDEDGGKVAVRCLPAELCQDSAEMEKVLETFRQVEKLRHPNIAEMRALEKDETGTYYLVTDLAEGVSLRKWLWEKRRSGKVGLMAAAAVLRQVAAALDYAHWEHVMHRDVRPENVMIDEEGWVKVLDFGLSAQIRTSLGCVDQGTSGMEPYRAPEVWAGQPGGADADQYSLAVMAYEMVSGRLPFENSDLAALRKAVLEKAPRTIQGLSERASRAFRRALAKSEEERFRSCVGFVAALAGSGRRRKKRRKTLLVWSVVLVFLLAGVWLTRGRLAKMLGLKLAHPKKDRAVEVSGLPKRAIPDELPAFYEVPDGTFARPEEELKDEPSVLPEATQLEVASSKAPSEDELVGEVEAADEPPAFSEGTRMEVVSSEPAYQAEPEAEVKPADMSPASPVAAEVASGLPTEVLEESSISEEEATIRLVVATRSKSEVILGLKCERGQGFGEKLDEMQEKLLQGKSACLDGDYPRSKALLEESLAAAGWVETNAPLRAVAFDQFKAARTAKHLADAQDSIHLAPGTHREANRHAKAGADAFMQARFEEAARELETAARAYAHAAQEAAAARAKAK